MRDLIHSIVNGDDEFNGQFSELMKSMGGEMAGDLEPVDFANANVTGGLHQTLKAILTHLEGQNQKKQKTVQAVRDQGGRLIGAKVIED